jgi:clan AA aspartic protease
VTGTGARPGGISGHVNERREAVVEVWVKGARQRARTTCVIDTGYTGTLVVSEGAASDLGMRYAGSVRVTLADGSMVVLPRYEAEIEWVGGVRSILASAIPLGSALVGTKLLDGHRLAIDYAGGSVEVA